MKTNNSDHIYQVIDYKVPALREKIQHLSNKAVKLGLAPITFEVLGSEVMTSTIKGTQYQYTEYTIKVDGISPKIDGWLVAAKLDHLENGNIIRSLVDFDLPTQYRNAQPTCEHCNQNRARLSTFVLIDDSGNFKQVGTTCLKDFTGHPEAERIAEFYAMFDMEAILEELDNNSRDCWDMVSSGRYTFPLWQYFAYVLRDVRKVGYRATSKRGEYDGLPTRDSAMDAMIKGDDPLTEDEKNESRQILSLLKVYIAKQYQNDYISNLGVILDAETIEYKQAGFAASLAVMYHKMQETQTKENLEPEQKQESQWIGEIGQKLSNMEVTLVSVTTYEKPQYSYYDSSIGRIYKFVDNSGNLLVWFTSNMLVHDKANRLECVEPENGIKVTIKSATIKQHSDYNGQKQTILNRTKLVGFVDVGKTLGRDNV